MNAAQIWQVALGELEPVLSKHYFQMWVRTAAPLGHADGVFTLGAPSTFAKEYLEQKCLPQLRRSISGIVGRETEVEIVVSTGETGSTRQGARRAGSPGREVEVGTIGGRSGEVGGRRRGALATAEPPASDAADLAARAAALDDDVEVDDSQGPTGGDSALGARGRGLRAGGGGPAGAALPEGLALNPRYTFETFVVGSSNRLAHAASLAVADKPAAAYKPLFIYGGVGLGKTHLLHAIGHRVARRGLRVLYLSSERFTNDLINAIRTNRTEEFRSRYRTIDMLLIDDIQFIAGKETTQEEFFHTFNALHEANRQIVLCSDRPPKSITTLEDRLRTRFEWGLIADVTTPDFEHRCAILQAKAATLDVPIPPAVVEYVARKVQSNIRELEGSLNRIVALASLTGQPIRLETAAAALGDILDNPNKRFITGAGIVEAVAKYYGVDPKLLRGKKRDREIVVPRHVAMHLMRQETSMSLVEIGRELGGRDHSTVLHGCDKIAGDLQTDQRLRRDVDSIRQLLYDAAKP